MKKVYYLTLIPIFSLLMLATSFLVACSSKDKNAHSANTIPNSNVYEEIAQYVQTYGQLDEFGRYLLYIVNDKNATMPAYLGYSPNQNMIAFGAADLNIGEFDLTFCKNVDYSKNNHKLQATYFIENAANETHWDYNYITLPATIYIDMHTTAKLPNKFSDYSLLNLVEQSKIIERLTPIVSWGLNTFSNFYANTIKKSSQYLGATYKYFYLPVIK